MADEERERTAREASGKNSGQLAVIYLQDGRGVSTSFDECPSGVSATRLLPKLSWCENLSHLMPSYRDSSSDYPILSITRPYPRYAQKLRILLPCAVILNRDVGSG